MHWTARAREEIKTKLAAALAQAIEAGLVPEVEIPDFTIEVPREKEHGDFAANLALVLAKPARMSSREIAGIIERTINENLERADTFIRKVEVAGPGFLNFFLHPAWLYAALEDIALRGSSYGHTTHGGGKSILVEFVSANPTGPLNVANARAAAVGDALARLLNAAGYSVSREFYVNDAGNQFNQLGIAMEIRCRQLQGEQVKLPEGAYPGEYITHLAREFLKEKGDWKTILGLGERRDILAEYAVEQIVQEQKGVLESYGVRFDNWFSERKLRREKGPEAALQRLRDRGAIYEADGATWFAATRFGDEKDRVVVKQDGELTYLLADIAYHLDKLSRGYWKLINLWGPDHHGYIARLQGAVEAAGYPRDVLEVMIIQWVRLFREGQPVKMSKRGGEFISMDELLEEVGRDAARFFFLMRSPDSHLDFDLDLARLETNENPVFYVQYAHARIASVLREAAERGVSFPWPAEAYDGGGGDTSVGAVQRWTGASGSHRRRLEETPVPAPDLALLKTDSELQLIRRLVDFPEEIIMAADSREPHRITAYLREVATLFHAFYTECRILGDDPDLTAARLYLAGATRTVLANGLRLLGVSAPDRM